MITTLNCYNDYLTFKKAHGFDNLTESSELNIAWGPLVKLVCIELFTLYDKNGLRPYILFANGDYIVISFVEEV